MHLFKVDCFSRFSLAMTLLGLLRKLLLFLTLCFIFNLKAVSQPVIIKLYDKITGEPVPYAYILIRSLSESSSETLMSDKNGEVHCTFSPPLVITIKSLGYKEIQDTIASGESIGIGLSPRYYQLDHIVVTGQFRPQIADRSIYRINLIDSRKIQLKASNNMADLLKTELGFQYQSEGILGDFIRIRGLSGEYVKLLIDGMPVTGRVADKLDLGQFSLHNIDHIEVIEGPVSVIYGSNALGGAINLITSDESNKNLSAAIGAYYETAGVYDFDAAFSRQTKGHTVSVQAARKFFTGWGPIDTSRYKTWKPKLQYLLSGSYRYKKNDLSLHYTTDFLYEDLRDQDSLSLATLYEKALDGYHFTKRWNNRLNLVRKIGNNFFLNVHTGYSYYNKSKITYLNDLVRLEKTVASAPELHDTTKFHLITSRSFISNMQGEKLEYQSGLDLNYEAAKGKRTQGHKDITDLAAFMNIIYRPSPAFSIQPGIRFIYNSKYKAPVVYAVNIKYSQKNIAIYGSYGKGFRAPSLKQLYLQFIDSNHEIIGNKNLKAETAHDISIASNFSLMQGNNSISIDLNIFYNAIHNAIQLAIDTLRLGWGTYFNIEGDDYKTKGFEAKVRYNLYSGITLDAGLITTGRMRLNRNHAFDYSTDFVSGFSYRNERHKYQLSVFYKYTDNYLEFAGNYGPEGQLNGIAERFIEKYHTLDVTLYKTLYKDKLTLTGGIKNLFDVTMVASYGNLNFHGSSQNSVPAGYGRSFFLKLNYRFEKL